MAAADFPLIFERSRPGRKGSSLPAPDVPLKGVKELIPERFMRTEPPPLPEVSEPEVARHYVALSQRNHSIDTHFYPLGSCTMKYNPKVNETAAAIPGFARLHPYQDEDLVQGILEVLAELARLLATLTGLPGISLQPAAGAQGELTGLLIANAWFRDKGENRTKVLIPDSAHGTNPASCTLCGLTAVQVKSDASGLIDLEDLARKLGPDTAALMITNPNTLGLFEARILEASGMLKEAGALMYMDGANFNALVGTTRPADFGADIMHINTHKTFSTPHGGGGPGAGPIAVREELIPYLPVPRINRMADRYHLEHHAPKSIGRVKSFVGNVGILLRAYAYIRSHGPREAREISEMAVLNANYLSALLKERYDLPYGERCMHEFVLSAARQKKKGVRALDVAKRLIDLGFHPPTIYFPLIVPEALMIEPTETESKETLDGFAAALLAIADEAEHSPEGLLAAPVTTPVGRLDEAQAARQPMLCWCQE